MNKEKLKEIFEELITYWNVSESTVINDRSINLSEDYKWLEDTAADYRKRFYEALES